MEKNIDKLFKVKIDSVENKPMEWEKERAWSAIGRRKQLYSLKQFLKYAAMLVFVLSSTLMIFYFGANKNGEKEEQKTLSREEKYNRLKIIEQRLTQEKDAFIICNTCFSPYLEHGSEPEKNGFKVSVFYQSL